MEQQVTDLKSFLNEELAVYDQLLALSKRKQKVLMEKFSTDLLKIVGEEEKQVRRLTEIEESRRKVVEELTGNPDAALDEFTEKISDTAIKADIWMIGTKLKDVVAEIKEINERNHKLLEQALELTQYSLSLITRPPKDLTYAAPGKQKPPRPTGPTLIDRKV